MSFYLIGSGIDFHNLKVQKDGVLFLGTVKIKKGISIIAHSDGDLIIHSLCDAILGALGKKDLGEYFNESNTKKSQPSLIFLDFCLRQMKKEKYVIHNIDFTLICEHVFVQPLREEIVNKVKHITNCDRVNLKATKWENKKDLRICVMCSLLLKKNV